MIVRIPASSRYSRHQFPPSYALMKPGRAATQMGQGEPIEQAIAIMMEAHWRSAVHPNRVEGIGAFNEDREPDFQDPDH